MIVKAGFPDIVFSNKSEIEDYRIEADGVRLPYKNIKGNEIKSIPLPENLTMMEGETGDSKLRLNWLASEVHFKQGEEKKLNISYASRYQMSLGGVSDDTDYDPEIFRYLLSTAATWKGPIKKGTIIITAVSVDADSFILQPKGKFRRKGKVFTWKFENFKPTQTDDIIIDFNNPVSAKMNYNPNDKFGSSFYIFEEKKKKYYYEFHSYTAEASSTLNQGKKDYSTDNIADMKRDSAWCEGRDDSGTGEYLLLKLKEPKEVTHIGIIPGYAKSRDAYFNNNRVSQVTAIINDSYRVTSSVPDEYVSYDPYHPKAYHFIDVSGFKGTMKTIKLIISKVYPGAKYKDTCIGEVILRHQLKSKPQHAGAR